jgi:hypothetical protein
MPSSKVTYSKNGTDHKIEMSWGMFFRNFTVSYDGIEIGRFENQKQLNKGRDFTLPTGEILRVKKTQKMMTVLIEVLINGEPVNGTATDPKILVRNAYMMAIFLCALNFIVGLLAYFFRVDFLLNLGFGWYNMIISLLYLAPILIGYKSKSWIALCFVLAVFLLDTLNGLFWIIELNKRGEQVNGGSMVMRFVFGMPLFLGAKAGFLLKNNKAKSENISADIG